VACKPHPEQIKRGSAWPACLGNKALRGRSLRWMAAQPSARKVDRTPLIVDSSSNHLFESRTVLHLPYRELPTAEPHTDTRSPLRYLIWIAAQQKIHLTFNALFGIGLDGESGTDLGGRRRRDRPRRHPQERGELFLWSASSWRSSLPGDLRRTASPTGRDQSG